MDYSKPPQLDLFAKPDAAALRRMSRRKDPATSKDAARGQIPKLRTKQILVLQIFQLYPEGLTGEELQNNCREAFGWAAATSTARTRRAELRDLGLIVERRDGEKVAKRTNSRGQDEIVWMIAGRGRTEADSYSI